MDMVERVARAMAPMFAEANSYWCNGTEWPDCPPATCQCRKMAFEAARAAIAAMREPTEEMVRAGLTSLAVTAFGMPEFEPRDEAELCFTSMIDAALTSSEK